ncbi:MAG: hypothetical protein K8963_11475 [Proteobacteria bacterium]|nr:hypothetical protein [Pseudomonadota bacterium]
MALFLGVLALLWGFVFSCLAVGIVWVLDFFFCNSLLVFLVFWGANLGGIWFLGCLVGCLDA